MNTTEETPLMSFGQMLAFIRCGHNAIYADDDIGGGPIDSFDWTYHPKFNARITIDGLNPDQRAAWMRDELAEKVEEEPDHIWAILAEEDIQEPCVLVVVEGKTYCWDGNHRIGSRCIGPDPFLPAIIGTPKVAPAQSSLSERSAA